MPNNTMWQNLKTVNAASSSAAHLLDFVCLYNKPGSLTLPNYPAPIAAEDMHIRNKAIKSVNCLSCTKSAKGAESCPRTPQLPVAHHTKAVASTSNPKPLQPNFFKNFGELVVAVNASGPSNNMPPPKPSPVALPPEPQYCQSSTPMDNSI